MKTITFLKSLKKGYTKYSFFTIMLLLLYAGSFAQKVLSNIPSLRLPTWTASHELLHTTDDFGFVVLKRVPILFTKPDTTRVGIGISLPQAKLDVNGAIIARGNISGFNLSLTGNINANSLSLTDGITATNLSLSNNLTTNNLTVTGNFSAINLSLTGNINATSLSLTDGITAPNLSLSNNLTTNNLSVTGNLVAVNAGFSGTIAGNILRVYTAFFGSINANSLSLTGDITATNLSLSNNLTTNNLTVAGNGTFGSLSSSSFTLTDGTQGNGKVLISNANGLASWQNITSSGWTISGNNIYRVTGVNGRVGIGTDNPQKVLHIYTTHSPTSSDGGGGGGGGISGSHQGIRLENHGTIDNVSLISNWDIEPKLGVSNSKLSFKNVTNDKVVLTLADTGNVGIGTTDPAAKLNIFKDGEALRLDKTTNSDIAWYHNGARQWVIRANDPNNANFPGVLEFWSPTGKSVFFANKVGIGTPDPAANLEVNSGGTDLSPIVAISTPSAGDFIALFGGRQGNQNPFISWKRGPLRFATANTFEGGSFSEKMRITESGKVGIGTTNPTTKLHLSGDAGSVDLLKLQNTNATYPRSYRIGPGAGAGNIFGIYDDNATATRVAIDFNGNVGIGTTSPGYMLDVCGTIRAKKVKIESSWCDYVFDENYERLSILNKEKFYKQNNHLPNIPPAKEIETYGLDISDVMKGMVQNIEEDRLDITELYKIIMQQQMEIEGLKNELQVLKK